MGLLASSEAGITGMYAEGIWVMFGLEQHDKRLLDLGCDFGGGGRGA